MRRIDRDLDSWNPEDEVETYFLNSLIGSYLESVKNYRDYGKQIFQKFVDRISSKPEEIIYNDDLIEFGKLFRSFEFKPTDDDISDLFLEMEEYSTSPRTPLILRHKFEAFLEGLDPYYIRSTCRRAYDIGYREGGNGGIIEGSISTYYETEGDYVRGFDEGKEKGFYEGFYEGREVGFYQGRIEGANESLQSERDSNYFLGDYSGDDSYDSV